MNHTLIECKFLAHRIKLIWNVGMLLSPITTCALPDMVGDNYCESCSNKILKNIVETRTTRKSNFEISVEVCVKLTRQARSFQNRFYPDLEVNIFLTSTYWNQCNSYLIIQYDYWTVNLRKLTINYVRLSQHKVHLLTETHKWWWVFKYLLSDNKFCVQK